MNDYLSTRIWKTTIMNLRMIYAMTGESMVSIMERLVKQELELLEGLRNEQRNLSNQK